MQEEPWGHGTVVELATGFEVLTGLTAGLWGIVGLALATYGPILHQQGSPALLAYYIGDAKWLPRLAGAGLSPFTIIFLVVMFLCAVGIGTGAYQHSRHRIRAGLVLLWLCSVIFLVGMAICDLSIVVSILLSGPLALASAIAGSVAELWSGKADNRK